MQNARTVGELDSDAAASCGRDPVADFGPDYLDRFAVDARDVDLAARDWARRSLTGAEAANAAFGRLIWGALLGFELDRGAPGTMFGWRVESDAPEQLVLDADGSRMAGRMVFGRSANGAQFTWTTMLRFHGPAGRRIWSVAGNVHRFIAPRSLSAARPVG